MIKEVFPMRKNAERSHITERKKKPMKKFLWFAAVLVLLCMTQAFAESEATPSVLPQATETPTPLAAASDECLHLNIYVVSDLKTHCEFENASHHIIVAYYETECFDCHDFFRDVIVSETAEAHQFVADGDHCDPIHKSHTYWQTCTGCGHTTETTVFCRGTHADIMPKAITKDNEDT